MAVSRTSSATAVIAVVWLGACGALPTSVGTSGPPRTPTSFATPSTTPGEIALGAAGALAIVPLTSEEVARFDLLELEIQTDIEVANPFDPDELDIRVEFTSPTGNKSEIGAFWYRAYRPPGVLGQGEPSWKARFTPTEIGAWTAVARIPARGLESEPVGFRVTPSDNPGFVRINPDDPRYLAFDDGSFFFPIGVNMGWWTGAGDALTDYSRWITPFAANGGNAIRVWMAEWSFGIEWADTGLGDYSNRLGKAWLLDEIFRMAEENDIYIVLVLLNCADFNDWQTNGWKGGNPYNAARGGPLESPQQFATDPEARALLQRRLNYIANRWGYSPNLLAWEWWNEVNLTPISDEELIPWIREMTAYLRARDINRHLTTNSYAIRYLSPIWQMPELDVIQRHEYATQVDSVDRDLAGRAAEDYRILAGSAPTKPILLGEFGYGIESTVDDMERTGIHLHNGLWSTSFVGYAGAGMYWFWDVYLEAYRQWGQFAPLQRFLAGEDLTEYEPFSPLRITGPEGGPAPAVGLGLRGQGTLIWMRSDAYTVQASIDAQQRGEASPFIYNPPPVGGLTLTLDDMKEGNYLVRWYDPQRGKWLEEAVVTAQGGALSIHVPEFRRDLAAKIVPSP